MFLPNVTYPTLDQKYRVVEVKFCEFCGKLFQRWSQTDIKCCTSPECQKKLLKKFRLISDKVQ